MKCSEYGPWLSRYLDDDLEGKELRLFLEHLSLCSGCRTELRDLERIRFWLQEADAADRVSEERLEQCFEGFLERWDAIAGKETPDVASAETAPPDKESFGQRVRQALIPSRLASIFTLRPLPGFLSSALVLLLVGILGVWFYPREPVNSVDVQDLFPERSLATIFPQEEEQYEDMDLFVMHHATHQPWADIGQELPMIQPVSAPYR